MQFKEFPNLMEKRAHSELNPKDWVAKNIMDVIDNNNIYIHFGNIEKVGIDPVTQWETPNGVYAWQLNAYKKKIKERVADYKNAAIKTLGGYGLSEKSTTAEIMAVLKQVPENNRVLVNALNTIRGDGTGVSIMNIFPFRDDSKYVHILEAKSGLKWLKLYKGNASMADLKHACETLEMYLLNSNKDISKVISFDVFSVLSDDKEVFGKKVSFDQNEMSWVKMIYGIDNKHIKAVLNTIDKGNDSKLERLWYVRKLVVNVAEYVGYDRSNINKVIYHIVERVARRLDTNDAKRAAIKTVLFRAMGYDAIRDDGGGILYNSGEPSQVVFLTPNSYIVKKTMNNDSLSRLKRQEWFGYDSQTGQDSTQKFENSHVTTAKLGKPVKAFQ